MAIANSCLWLGLGFGLFASFDVFWFLRLAYTYFSAFVKKPLNMIEREQGIIYSLCYTTDIDYFCHMNNSKYFREMDFGRFDFYFRSGLGSYFRRHPNMYVVQHEAMMRYRRSINFLMPYALHTRLIYYDERSLYFEQRFITLSDGFVRAIGLCKNTAVNCNVKKLMRDVFGMEEDMECPEIVKTFINANETYSQKLRQEVQPISNESGSLRKISTNVGSLTRM